MKMSEIVLSSSSDSVDKPIGEYIDPSSFSGSNDSNSSGSGSGSSSEGNTKAVRRPWTSFGSCSGRA